MKLMNGKLYWPTTLPNPPRYPALDTDMACDVVIVGGGIAGALCAYYLMKHDVKIALLEKRQIGGGSSMANIGLLQFASDKSLTSCIHSFGEVKGTRFYQLCKQAIDQLEAISHEVQPFPDFQRKDSLYYASSPEDLDALRTEYALLKQHGFPVSFWERADIERHCAFSKPGAIYAGGDAQINPYRLTASIIAAVAARGMNVFEKTEFVHVKADACDMLVYTEKGHRIRCKKIVFATGYEAQAMKRNRNTKLSSTSAIVTAQVPALHRWPNTCLIWETARPYVYIRSTRDGRIIAGGMDEPVTDPQKREATLFGKRDKLLARVAELFPHIPLTAEFFWSAAFASTHDGLPLIGAQQDEPDCLFVLGYGGNGTVYSTIGGQIIADLIVKGKHPDAELFSLERTRFPSAAARPRL
ncbi:NAD(P)/FAD-dependent oxidoreductase [Brevibacillus sp. GCM10020057]|uniref:NAD(P)/FAD-dependent oxidoreductase n=1 Tax=Brevibacillus sp. GCM10020057 TaxID=3317327 RepID=UPI0036324AE3